MNPIETKEGILVQGLNEDISNFINIYCDKTNLIYSGKIFDIPEEIARECVETCNSLRPDLWGIYRKYTDHTGTITGIVKTAKESIQSAVTKPNGEIYQFIIIWRKY